MTDIVEELRVSAANEGTMLLWDKIRGMIARGDDGSRPRDIFEAILSAIDEERSEAAAEIERLRLSLSEARATGRREGLSEALKLADALRDEQRRFQTLASDDGFKNKARDHESMKFAAVHLSSAIRAAMEKAE